MKSRPGRAVAALAVHTACQFLYIGLSFVYFVQERPVWVPVAMVALACAVDAALARRLRRPFLVSLATVAAANSVFLNMEGYGTLYWPFFLALFVALASKYLIRVRGRPVFNPSTIGVFFVAMLFPAYGTGAIEGWKNAAWLVGLVFALGLLTTILAGTWRLCLSYAAGFILTGLALPALGLLGLHGRLGEIAASATPLFWPSAFFTFGTGLFLFHVIGDPGTAPRGVPGKIAFGFLLGAADLIFRALPVWNGGFAAYLILQAGYGLWSAWGPTFGEVSTRILKTSSYRSLNLTSSGEGRAGSA